MHADEITEGIIGAGIAVHSELGPGLLESTYRTCLRHELGLRGLTCAEEVAIPITYKGIPLDCGYRIDLLVENQIVVELKAVDRLDPVFTAQVLTYLRLSNRKVGLLMNFNVPRVMDGIKRIVLGFSDSPRRPSAPRR